MASKSVQYSRMAAGWNAHLDDDAEFFPRAGAIEENR